MWFDVELKRSCLSFRHMSTIQLRITGDEGSDDDSDDDMLLDDDTTQDEDDDDDGDSDSSSDLSHPEGPP